MKSLGKIKLVQRLNEEDYAVATEKQGIVYISSEPILANLFRYRLGVYEPCEQMHPNSRAALKRYILREGLTSLYHLT
jgi:hypothetical protein